MYGFSLQDFDDLKIQGKNELGQIYYISERFASDIWKHGFCLLSEVSWNTCAYVARYVKKKDYGLVSDEFVNRCREPEYSVMSRDPGIGLYFPLEHPEFENKSKFYFGDQNGLVEVYFPRIFLKFLEENNPELYESLKEQRSKAAKDSEMNKIMQTDLSSMELDELSENHISSTEKVIDFYRGL